MRVKGNFSNQISGKKILLGICGSIAAVKVPTLVSQLIKEQAEVKCVLTKNASKLVSPISLASLSRNKCYQDKDEWNETESKPLHISLAEWAEIIVIAPLSASCLGRIANGIGDDLLSSLILAFEKPVIFVPAMNTGMWRNEMVQENWQRVSSQKNSISLPPSFGLLACDRIGEGKLADPKIIHLAIANTLLNSQKYGFQKKDLKGLRLLISAGPTLEAIDPIRAITNRSSGIMGIFLAQAARFRGAHVDFVHGPLQMEEEFCEGLSNHEIETAEELQDKLKQLHLQSDILIMAAAVGDLRRRHGKSSIKISKDSLLNSFMKDLEEVPDLLESLVSNKTKNQIILGFAAVSGNEGQIKQAGLKKIKDKGCDLLFANPIDRDGQGVASIENGGYLISKDGRLIEVPKIQKLELAHHLLDVIQELKTNIY